MFYCLPLRPARRRYATAALRAMHDYRLGDSPGMLSVTYCIADTKWKYTHKNVDLSLNRNHIHWIYSLVSYLYVHYLLWDDNAMSAPSDSPKQTRYQTLPYRNCNLFQCNYHSSFSWFSSSSSFSDAVSTHHHFQPSGNHHRYHLPPCFSSPPH